MIQPNKVYNLDCLVAKKLKRCYTGFEIDEEYFRKSVERIENDRDK